jgi:predicted phage tail component-like protein
VIYDGFDLSGILHIEAIRRSLLPPFENESTELSGRDGSVHLNTRLGTGTVEVDVRLICPATARDEQQAQLVHTTRLLAEKLYKTEPCSLVLPDMPDVYHMALLDGSTELERISYSQKTTLSFICFDPVGYGTTRELTCDGGELYLNVAGNYETAPIVEIESVSGPITVTFDDEDFTTLNAVNAGDLLVLDAESHTCMQGESGVYYNILSDFPVWMPGVHTISCEMPYTVRWTERWM